MHTVYAPDGRTIAWTSTQHQLNFLTLGRETGETKDQWRASERAGAQAVAASAGIFNHAGNGMVLVHQPDHNVRIVEYPALDVRESMAAHVSGGIVVALDPRGRCVFVSPHNRFCATHLSAGILSDILRQVGMIQSSISLIQRTGYAPGQSPLASESPSQSIALCVR